MMGQENTINNTAMTYALANRAATISTPELDSHARRLAELEASGIIFSQYLFEEDLEACPPLKPQCKDCGGDMYLWHKEELAPSTRCSGVSFFLFTSQRSVWLI